MRIISGKFRSRRLHLPSAQQTRPTADRTRESLFNILTHIDGLSFDNAYIADVFAGSGALGLEALSRGAAHTTFFENNALTLNILRQNIHILGLQDSSTIISCTALRPPSSPRKMDLCFFDPPYEKFDPVEIVTLFSEKGWIGSNTLVVYEMSATAVAPEWPVEFTLLSNRNYGAAGIYILKFSRKP